MRTRFLSAALLLLVLPSHGRKDEGKAGGDESRRSDRESAAQLQERKPAPVATPLVVLPNLTPITVPAKESAKRSKADKQEPTAPGQSSTSGESRKGDRDKFGKQKEKEKKQNRPDQAAGPLVTTPTGPDVVPEITEPATDFTPSDDATPGETPQPDHGTINPGAAVMIEGTAEQETEDPHPTRKSRRDQRRAQRTPALARPTVFVPAGMPPPSAGATPVRGIGPRPSPTPSVEKQQKLKKRKLQPTPGPTPVPTPSAATPTPANFHPPDQWRPPSGWVPPAGWKPPSNWAPAGGWVTPPGWKPPRNWVLRLSKWGWCYVPRRGWVIPPRWVPPPSFVTPPGWYYLPRQEYGSYQVCDPAIVVVTPGIARPDLVEEIEPEEPYTPSDLVAEEITEEDEEMDEEWQAVERPLPEEPPTLERNTTVDDIIRALTRERDPDNRYAGPVYATQQVQFEDDDYAILPQSFEMLNALGEALLDEPLENTLVSIEAHLNDSLDDEEARTLTRRRAWSVKGYLVQKFGLDPERLIFIGYGNDAPIAPHDTDDGLAMNERLEIENVSDLFATQGAGSEAVPSQDDETTSTEEPAPVSITGTTGTAVFLNATLTSSTLDTSLPIRHTGDMLSSATVSTKGGTSSTIRLNFASSDSLVQRRDHPTSNTK
ncbi:MAG: OmpA family protein [Candidatus Sumerlaeaceae bacterium]